MTAFPSGRGARDRCEVTPFPSERGALSVVPPPRGVPVSPLPALPAAVSGSRVGCALGTGPRRDPGWDSLRSK